MAPRKSAGEDVGRIVARRLREARDAKGWTQQDLSNRLKAIGHAMDRTTIAKIEKKQRQVRVEELVAMAAALDVAPVHLFLPIEEESSVVALAPKLKVDVAKARRWSRGRQPLSADNVRFYIFQSPGDIAVTNPEGSPEQNDELLDEWTAASGIRAERVGTGGQR